MLQKPSPLAYSKQAPTLLPNRQTPGEQLFSSAHKPAASLARKELMTSYPGELLDLDHQTISLRTQLRLSYETYTWLRYLTWCGLALAGVLLLVLPGGFPPRAFLQVWQTVPLLSRLLDLHGASALFSFVLLCAQALTWFVLWGLWGFACHSLARYTWHLYRTQSFLASAWLPSHPREKRLEDDDATPGPETQHAQGTPLQLPKMASPGQSAPAFAHARSSSASRPVQAVRPADTALFTGLPETMLVAPTATAPAPLSTAPAPQTTRQFAQPTMPLTRPRMHTSPGEPSFGWPFSSGSSAPGVAWDVGIKRRGRPNEDSVLTLRGTCNVGEKLQPFELHMVADGMGGHENGRLASHLAIRSMLETVVPGLVACTNLESEGIIDILIDGVHWANQVIYQYGQEQKTDLGTTLTAVLLLSETAYIINVGDSRTYVYRPGAGLTQITRDHSLVARLVETGAISPEEIYTHPDRNKVYRGLGDKSDVTVDWFVLPVQAGDLLLLCSDGLWEMVRDPQIAEILQTYASSPALASSLLLRAALQAGGSDNVGLLVVKVQP
jgi:serine/threonine protein phosphatase PrpC